MAYLEPAPNMERLYEALAAARLSSGRPNGPMPGSAKTSALPAHSEASPAAARIAKLMLRDKQDPRVAMIIAATRGGTPHRPAPKPMVLPPELLQMALQGGPQGPPPGMPSAPMGAPPGMSIQ